MDSGTIIPLVAMMLVTVGGVVLVTRFRVPGVHLWSLVGGLLGIGGASSLGILISGEVIENSKPVAFVMLGCLVLIVVAWVTLMLDRRRMRNTRVTPGDSQSDRMRPLG